jgi:hypothetical protein
MNVPTARTHAAQYTAPKNRSYFSPSQEAAAEFPEEEARIDPSDGTAYTKQSFVEAYGGTTEWERAAPPGPAALGAVNVDDSTRIDPTDGVAYTMQSFIEAYGGTSEWDRAVADVELRIDPSDGNAYNKESFVEAYGGTIEWDIAKPASKPGSSGRGEYQSELVSLKGILGSHISEDLMLVCARSRVRVFSNYSRFVACFSLPFSVLHGSSRASS